MSEQNPQKAISQPAIRFKGFTDSWEQRKLGSVSDIVGGGTPDTKNSDYWNGDIFWFTPAEINLNVYVSRSEKTITELGLNKCSAKILPAGTILFTARAGIGKTAILAVEASTNQGFQSIVPDSNQINNYFLYTCTPQLKKYAERVGAGSTFVEVSAKAMSNMNLYMPALSEQEQIGKLFEQLDTTLTLQQRKLDSLKELKKSLLKAMFI